LTEAEIETVMLAADRYRRQTKPDARPYTLLALLLATGIKKSECLGIRLNNVDLQAPMDRSSSSAMPVQRTDIRNVI